MNKGILYIYVWGKVLQQLMLTRLGKIEVLSSKTWKAIYICSKGELNTREKKVNAF